ncbi:MAG: serine hydrolase [Marinifilaceae bacterium]
MKIYLKAFYITLVSILIFSNLNLYAQDANKSQSLLDLQDTIREILTKTNTPGAGVIMVSGDSLILLKGMGKADLEKNIDVNENTMFRLGSVSKLFVSLAILKLQEDGSLSLKDKVSDLISDIKINNPWKENYPIRIENLLEHSSGLNDWSWAELGSDDSKPKTLKEALDYYPKGRIVRFVPGSRMQYSNLAVSIAAYIVEKVSGMTYESYVDKYFFKPLGMKNATFRNSKHYQEFGAKGYDNGVLMPYYHLLYRPSAAFTDSPKELFNLLKFFINRGKVDGVQILSESSLNRMERNESIFIEHSDFLKDYGLGNVPSLYKNFIYRGHGGSVPGSNTDFCYLPEYKLGFAIMINGNNQGVLYAISRLIKKYQTKDLPQQKIENLKINNKSKEDFTGFYVPMNYKFDCLESLVKIKQLRKMWHKGDTLYVKNVLRQYPKKFYSNGKNEFEREDFDGFVIFKTNDPIEGEVIYGDMGILKEISSIYAFILLIIFWAFYITSLTVFIFAIIRLLIYFFGKKKNKVALWVCLLPLLNTLVFFVTILILFISINTKIDAFLLLGNISSLSVLIFIGTIAYAVISLWVPYFLFKNRNIRMSKVFYYHSVLVAIFNLIFTVYFFSNGLIGIQTWI